MIHQMKIVKPKPFKDRLKGHKESVIALHYPSGMGELLYSFSRDGYVRVWDLANRIITNKFILSRDPQTQQAVQQQNFKEEQQQPKQQKPEKVQENKQKQKQKQKQIFNDQYSAAIFTNNTIFASSESGSIDEWVLKTHQIKSSYKGHSSRIQQLVVIPSLNLLVSGGKDSTIKTWPTTLYDQKVPKSKQLIQQQLVYKVPGAVTSIKTSSHQIHALVNRHIFFQIDAQKKQVIRCIYFDNQSFSTFILYEQILYLGNIENKLNVCDLTGYDGTDPSHVLKPIQTIQGIGGWVLIMKISQDKLYCGSDDKKIRVYDISNPRQIQQVQQLVGHEDGVISIEFIDKLMYTGSFDQSIRSWQIEQMVNRIRQRKVMQWQAIQSKKFQVYYGIAFRGKKKKTKKKTGK